MHDLSVENHTVRCLVDTAQLDGFLNRLATYRVQSLISQPPTLEELFLRLYADDGPAAGGAEPAAADR